MIPARCCADFRDMVKSVRYEDPPGGKFNKNNNKANEQIESKI
jgi:hypothetical protein